MMAAIRSMKQNGAWLTFCALCGVLGAMFFPTMAENIRDAYDTAYPPWIDNEISNVVMGDSEVTFSWVGTKKRDCDYFDIRARVGYEAAASLEAYITRTDMVMVGRKRPLGRQKVGDYLVKPTRPDAKYVLVWLDNNCDGRIVTSKIATIILKK
jgi:hypothetical protein